MEYSSISNQPQLFQFEADFVDSLRCIPMVVRLKLDTCGVKLKLSHWHQLGDGDRRRLVEMPCSTPSESTAYRKYLQNLLETQTGAPAKELTIDPHPAWLDSTQIPESVASKAAEFDLNINIKQWQKLLPLQRFALIKLSRPSHENRNFYRAAQEFNLV